MRKLALYHLLLAAGLSLAACQDEDANALHGYAEGDFITIAPDTAGRIVETLSAEGDRIEEGALLFRLDDQQEEAAVLAAEARLEAATARFDDAAAGARAPEIAAARDQLTQAQAAARDTAEALERTQDLFTQGHVSQARLDQAETADQAARARVAEMRQRLSLVQLPARENALRALQADIRAADAELDRLADLQARRYVHAPTDGRIHRQIRFAGEMAGPAQPVYDFLPESAVHALLFIPETQLSGLPVGTRLRVSCDGCAAGLTARISTIAEDAEFTPPVIYSDNERDRLVWRAEAIFDGTPPPPGTPLRFEPQE
ncbi:HlyD family secretion protein [Maricaulis parjimensis]|uniref:HlyD family secretion protein n=1 Tax=Maricaulis parjimensis TaxID=144023 RepID=UPI00193A2CFA|nr:HlyD family efflux transporter periplasmic adaptor subunit [Maricaulis parjimensis]